MADYDAIVIGAGGGGITAGAVLAKQGRKVLLLEQSGRLGGCCSTFEKEGYSFDVGASIIEVIDSIEEAFRLLGTTLGDEVDLIPCDPVYSCIFRDGSRMSVPLSIEGTREAMAPISKEDADNLPRFAQHISRLLNESLQGFFTSPANGFGDMQKILRANPSLLNYGKLFVSTYQGVLRKWFKNDKIQQSMGFQSFYVGLPPELAPGIFALLAYSEHEGVWYSGGGMIAIPRALAACGEKEGMEIRLDTRVEKVMVRNGRVEGVTLGGGREVTAPVVISNINAKTLYLDLIGEEHLPWLARYGIKSYKPSISAVMLCLGIDYEPPLDAHHTIITAPFEEMDDYWWNRYLKGLPPEKQFGLICWATKSDPELAPKGCHVLNVILMGPAHLAGTDWDREKEAFLAGAIDFLEATALPGLSDHVKVAELITPLDYGRRLLHPDGAIYGLQEDLLNQTVFRPSSKSRSVKGLYLAGASTHPGGGVPAVIGSGIIAARLVDQYEK
jgi:phytoene desaturase